MENSYHSYRRAALVLEGYLREKSLQALAKRMDITPECATYQPICLPQFESWKKLSCSDEIARAQREDWPSWGTPKGLAPPQQAQAGCVAPGEWL